MITHLSTRTIPPRNRLDRWNELLQATHTGCEVRSESDLDAEFWFWGVGAVHLMRSKSSRSRVYCAADSGRAEEGRLKLYLQNHGSSETTRAARRIVLAAGDMALHETGQVYTVDTSQGNDLLMMSVPLELLGTGFEFPSGGSKVPGHQGSVSRLRGFIVSLWNEMERSRTSPVLNGLEDVLVGIIRMAADNSETVTADQEQEPFRRITAWIDGRLSDPGLSTALIAEHMGYAPRTLQELFARHGTTPTDYIVGARLSHARRLLELNQGLAITHIAYDVGFADASYFGRRFRQAYGMSPREFRARLLVR